MPLSVGQPHSPNVDHYILHFCFEDHREPHNEVWSLRPAELQVGFELGTFQFLLQRLNPLGHSPHTSTKSFDFKFFLLLKVTSFFSLYNTNMLVGCTFVLLLTFCKESFIRNEKNIFQFVLHKKSQKSKNIHKNDINFNCVNFTQTCRKATLIGWVKFMHIFFNLTVNIRRILTKLFVELVCHYFFYLNIF